MLLPQRAVSLHARIMHLRCILLHLSEAARRVGSSPQNRPVDTPWVAPMSVAPEVRSPTPGRHVGSWCQDNTVLSWITEAGM